MVQQFIQLSRSDKKHCMSFKKYIFVLAIIQSVYTSVFALNNIFEQYAKSLSSHLPKPKPIDTNKYTPETYIQYLSEEEKKLLSKIIEGNMFDRLKEVIIMHEKNGATVHSTAPQR